MLAVLRGVVSLLAATLAVGGAQLLRADSDGPGPRTAVLVVATAVLAVAIWPLTRRRHHVALLFGALLTAQLAAHALLLLVASGQLGHGGATGLVCCPPSPAPAGGGVLAGLTAQAGWLLLAVQVLAVLLLALSLRGLQGAVLDVAHATTAVVRTCIPPVRALVLLLTTAFQPRPTSRQARSQDPGLPKGRQVASAVRRRGPPAGEHVSPSRPLPRGAFAL